MNEKGSQFNDIPNVFNLMTIKMPKSIFLVETKAVLRMRQHSFMFLHSHFVVSLILTFDVFRMEI